MSAPATMNLSALGVTHMTSDSRQVTESSVFVAYVGEHNDGRNYIAQAIANGAKAVIYEAHDFAWNNAWQVAHFAVSQLRQQVSQIASEFYGHPSQSLWMIGVTGTNGKTSCTQWIAHAMNALGKKSAVIGTIGNGFVGQLSATNNTTPDPILLQQMLADYVTKGAQVVAMEVSSHGLAQGRVSAVAFDVAVFTNLTHDHLDYHGSMEVYAEAKRSLFEMACVKHAILNMDDAYGQQWADTLAVQGKSVITYGLTQENALKQAHVQATNLKLSQAGIAMQVQTMFGQANLQSGLYGKFNASNLLAVLASLLVSEVTLEQAVAVIQPLQSVAGRMQSFGGGKYPVVIVDYAHTPDALEKVLLTLREQTHGALICVFGCGGNRDAAKRAPMGKIANDIADYVVVTTDNPRDEAPEAIAAQILQGIERDCLLELDRTKAIIAAISRATPADIVLVAGKGHEEYQEIAGVKTPFSDVTVVAQALAQYEVTT